MSKGFVTIATGKNRYYEMAYNLCLSYKFFNGDNNIPFALICDRENQYTKIFDKIIIIDNPSNSFMDKLQLSRFDIFDETIFIDADSLVYGEIDNLFSVFDVQNNFAFSAFGTALPLDSNRGWFTKDGAGEYKNKIQYCVNLHGGMYFIRKKDDLKDFYCICLHILDNFGSFVFSYPKPCDESIVALAMAVLRFQPINNALKNVIIYPGTNKRARKIKISEKKNGKNQIIHFGNIHTSSPKYRRDVSKIAALINGRIYKINPLQNICWYVEYWFKLLIFAVKKVKEKLLK